MSICTQETIHLQRIVDKDTITTYILTEAIDSVFTVISNDRVVEPVVINGVHYTKCNIGDYVIINFKYNKNQYTRRYKITGVDSTGLLFHCVSAPTEEESIFLQMMELFDKCQKGEIHTEEAHMKADELLLTLLYNLKLDNIADAYIKIPKWYA